MSGRGGADPIRADPKPHPMTVDDAQTLRAGAAALNVGLPEHAIEQLLAYLALLAKWNKTYNLTAIRDRAHMLTHHVLDALAPLAHLPEGTLDVLDVGSGGGVPGIPWAIVRPRWRVTVVEASSKKAAFLAQAAIELGLRNVEVRACRVEALNADAHYRIIASRAFADLATFVRVSMQLADATTLFAALKGELPVDEMRALPARIEVIATPRLNVPGVSAERHLILMRDKDAPA